MQSQHAVADARLVYKRCRPAAGDGGIQLVGAVIGGPIFGLIVTGAGYGAMYGTAAAVLVSGVLLFLPWDTVVHRRALRDQIEEATPP